MPVTVEMLRKAKALLEEQDRREFEAMLRPHTARMVDVSGEFVGRLDNADRDFFLEKAMEELWARRLSINSSNDVTRLWVASLEITARSRSRWLVSISHYGVAVGKEWVKPGQLRRKS